MLFAMAQMQQLMNSMSPEQRAQLREYCENDLRTTAALFAKLAKQIEQGAPVDVFISASKQWMDALADAKLIKPESRNRIFGRNRKSSNFGYS